MADVFRLTGDYTAGAAGCGSCGTGISAFSGEIHERVSLSNKVAGGYNLAADAPVSVDFAGLVQANVLVIKSDKKVRVRITSADGSTQSIPVDTLLIQISMSVPITAIDLTRVAGVATSVQVFLGERT